METRAVPWQRVALTISIVAVALTSVIVAFRADGFPAVDATVSRATRWFVHQETGRVVLADGFSGRSLARLDTENDGQLLEVVQSPSGVIVIDRAAATTRAIDAAALRLGPPQSLGLVAEPTTQVGVSQAGLVAVDPASAQALLVPPGGEAIPFPILEPVGAGDATRIAPDGAVWTLGDGELARVTTTGRQVAASGLVDARFTLIGSVPLLLDSGQARVRFGDGEWVQTPDGAAVSEVVLQEPGPASPCGWMVSGDDLWCIGATGVRETSRIDGLAAGGGDLLAIGGDAGALVRRGTSEIVRLDWRGGRIIDDRVADPPPESDLSVSVSTDLVWIDETDGDTVWAVNPWGISAIEKDDLASPLLGESGEFIDGGAGGQGPSIRGRDDTANVSDPDENGIDDPPVAIDDPVTARTGTTVPVDVTANDYDPDGEAIAVVSVGDAGRGSVEILSASTVLYQPEAGFVGVDEFEYTIADGNGSEATATVSIALLAADAANQAPIGAPDLTETGPDTPVVIDVLANDIDPERDSLRVASFTVADIGGMITEAPAPSGLPGLLFDPPPGRSGTATFTYRPVDSLGAVGEPVEVQVEIAQPSDENRPPIVRPDAVRVRRDVPATIPVLANDRDPDGDRMRVQLVDPPPPGVDVRLEGNDIVVTARAGAGQFSPFVYAVDDGQGHEVFGFVLVALIADLEPNRPPIATADTATAEVGTTQLIDVLANDSDPDGDPLVLVSVEPVGDSSAPGTFEVRGRRVLYTAAATVTDDIALDRFAYTISDGNDHEARGEVSVRVLPDAVAAPPFAQDDAATTEVDVPVTIDVLRNDSDPSGRPPALLDTVGCPAGGTATVTDDSRVSFTPPPGTAGVFGCNYEVRNSLGLTATATIVVTVIEPVIANIPPDVQDENVTVVVGGTFTVDVLDNDVDPDGPDDQLRVLSSSRPTQGVARRDGGVIVFEAGDVAAPTTITYQVGDVAGGVSIGNLVIRIVAAERIAPFVVDDSRTIVGPGVPTAIDVLRNDGDTDGEVEDLRLVGAELIEGDGTITLEARSITFRPPAEFVGDMVATYSIADADGLTAQGRATLTVLESPNRRPEPGDDRAEVINGGTVRIPIAVNDVDPDGDDLTYSIVSEPAASLGTATLDGTTLVFDAVPGASGEATVVYQVDDGELLADASVAISVLPCAAAAPVAPDLFFETGYQQPIAIDLTTTARNGDVVDVGPPLSAPSGVYTPPAGENGNITFTYVVRNACGIQDVGEVVIDVNQSPLGSAFSTAIGRFETVSIPISQLASDDEPLRIVGLQDAPGWVSVVDEQRAIVVDPAGRSGRVSFSAVIADPGGLQVTVPVVIDLVNRAPVAQPDQVEIGDGPVTISPLANDSDPDGDSISLGAVPQALLFANGASGTITREGNGQLRIDAGNGLGVATFEYTVVDALGLVSAPATVRVTVNRSPVAPDVAVDMESSTTVVVPIPATDAEGGALRIELIDDPAPLIMTVAGLNVTVTSPVTTTQLESAVRYRVTDPQGASAIGTIRVVVRRVPPTTTTTTIPPTTTTTTIPPTTTTTTIPNLSLPTTTTTPPPGGGSSGSSSGSSSGEAPVSATTTTAPARR